MSKHIKNVNEKMKKEDVLPITVADPLLAAAGKVQAVHHVPDLRKEVQLLQGEEQRRKFPEKIVHLQEVAEVVHLDLLPGVLQKVEEVQDNNR